MDPGSVLPLFGDDAKLDEGGVDETVLLSVWPLLFGSGSHAALRRRLWVSRLARALDDLVGRLEQWASVALSAKIDETAREGETDLGPELGRRFGKYLSEAIVPPERNERSDDSGAPQGDTGAETAVEAKEKAEAEAEAERIAKLIASLKKARKRFGVPESTIGKYLADFLTWDLGEGHLPDWDVLAKIDRALGGHRTLRRLAASTLAGYAALQRREADAYWRGVETVVLEATPVESLERTLNAYFDVGLARFRGNEVRPNTARQVRNGQVARLARWLGVGGIDLPVMLLDEPLLGQDLPASAALLGRYPRLRRKTEAVR